MLRGARDQSLEWLEVSRRMLLREMQSPSQGSVVMVARILDLLFIQVLRFWAASDDAAPSWLTGALDAQIGAALAAIHTDLTQDWTVERLANVCNLSRSAFAERFATRVGKPPASYLAKVRLEADWRDRDGMQGIDKGRERARRCCARRDAEMRSAAPSH
jgi:transcriptional regulator GlxA family with amidase domain